MNQAFLTMLFLIESETSEAVSESGSGSGTTEKITEALKNMVKSPLFYILIGALVLLIIAVYLIRRIVKSEASVVKVIVRGGKIYKLIDEKSSKYFMVPFTDRLAASISLNEREFNSDKLFINNGPDALYKINYNLKYKVTDINKYFPYRESFQNVIISEINDTLREYADEGHAFELVKDYRENTSKILSLINNVTVKYGVESLSLKVNFIEPLGKK